MGAPLRRFALALVVTGLAAAGCSPGSRARSCETRDDCGEDEMCLDGTCQPLPDGDGDADTDVDSDVDGDSDSDADHDVPDPIDFPDSDGDGISDLHEGFGVVDTDGDGTPDTEDLDSDGDGIADADEAGDGDDRTPPVDTDGDGVPDFRDLDADGDGIPDGVEGLVDSDGDGIADFLDLDSDGDGIGDSFEGAGDPDGDGLRSYLDDDSDGDGIADEREGGAGDPEVSPPDSDGDFVPDFLDLDSDGDTIPDEVEGAEDPDGDGLGSFRDPDSDGDGVADWLEAGDADVDTSPFDTDLDLTDDFLDLDSDGDTIADRHEYIFDTDGDGVHDIADHDSDNDGLGDAVEAGDADPATPPRDTDGDGLPDYRDTDSDNDGLSDLAESTTLHTDPYADDSDGDGVTDLIEYAAGTDPHDPADNPRARGDFVFLEPFMAPPDPTEDTLSFSTDIEVADVYFLMDTTGSMWDEIDNLQAGLTGTVIPGIRAAIPDVWFGVGGFADYPYSGYGSSYYGDRAYYHLTNMTGDIPTVNAGVGLLENNGGSDGPESHVPALHAMATGCGDGGGTYGVGNDPGGACTNPAIIGYPHFRAGSVPIVVLMTDAPMHNGPAGNNYGTIPGVTPPTWAETVAALTAIHARVIGVNSGSTYGRPDLVSLATATGTVGAGGPLVYDIAADGSGLGAQVIDAVEDLAHGVPMDITAVPIDDPSDAVDAVAAFIDHIEPNTTAGAPCTPGLATVDYDGDGRQDTFLDVIPGTIVCFDIVPRENHTVAPTADPQTFMATLRVWGDHVTVLDERDVYFLVPPVVPGGQ